MERNLLSKSSLLFWPGRPTASGGILLVVLGRTQGRCLNDEAIDGYGGQCDHEDAT
jgi:hypothetical protein